MTYYHQQVLSIRDRYLPKEYLIKQVMKSKQFIEQNYGGTIDLNSLASQASFSKFHFIRLFKSVYGRTPHQFLTEVRIEKAKQLLLASRPVTEVCETVGFSSLSSFTGLFRKMTGTLPSRYLHSTQ